ncbi:uncharacterized protein Z518_09768 [Rhinocladiella mackenziei CBS 650.93]|uniref:Uncharacterized protein n=1 Tax=Rhinocladiella mackenziei CBS 650.93 TaxID=1442369 RepID=A0A0D2GQW1_9EURO|nr:uncharacterized protein Z518_09768 [Rhinocladiella mackenziei CBS 650.93]KIX00703.1 hypothetical protein Z518_09768 [Rhinocladiella mackenziei CBS 650.93]
MSISRRNYKNDDIPSQHVDAFEELLASLTRINTYNPPVQTCSTGWTFHGLYNGPTSIAYLFFRLSQHYHDLMFKGQSLLDWAQAYLDLGAFGHRRGVDSGHCGIANEVTAQISIRAVMEQDSSLVQKLCSYESTVNDGSGSDEWLYGRSGYLYFLRLARSGFEKDANAAKLIDSTIQKTVQRILATKQPWKWHDKAYLGAAHGTLGILCQVVLSSPSSAGSIEHILSQVLGTQLSSGNFPSSLPASSDRLVQFCHGGPGAVLALRSLRPHFPSLQGRIDAAITAAQRDIWKRGVLTKQPCLCHGIAGNALALDDDAEFEHLLAYMSSDTLESRGWLDEAGRDDELVGLYTGEAGRAWAWAVADRGLERTCIGFNDL